MPAHGRRPRSLAVREAYLPFTVIILLMLLIPCLSAAAQTTSSDELTTREAEPSYKLEVERNLVLVRVVVRDSKGEPVGNLRQEDFRLFDKGKLQTISHFSVEAPWAKTTSTTKSSKSEPVVTPESELAPSAPRRYLALYFDDVHMAFEEVALTRKAAEDYFTSTLAVGDRVGIFTSSGVGTLDFTNDRAKLHEALRRIQPRPILQQELDPCPDISDYQAYLIVHERDQLAVEAAFAETFHCRYQDNELYREAARQDAETEALRRLTQFETETERTLRGLEQVIARVSVAPGQRNVVLLSPGFLTLTLQDHLNRITERALRTKIIINTLDSKGLDATPPLGDASKRPFVLVARPDVIGRKMEFQFQRRSRSADVLEQLATDTGGLFFRNSNDYAEGFRRVGALPEVYYTLAFSPQNLKYDGRFHTLKIKLVNSPSYSVESRRGYYAPKKSQDAKVRATEEIMQALFSQDELSEIPLEVHTQFFKRNELDASLSVLAHLDLHFLPFRKSEGRNLNNLTVVTALFDRDGNYLTGKEKRIEFRLFDNSLERLSKSGLTMRTSFDVKPGTYLVREVVRDTEGARISGLTRTVEIPF